MPRIWYEEGFRFSFFAADGREPPHVHVFKERATAKWWLDPVAEARSRRYTRAERSKIRRIVTERRELFIENWNDFFSQR